MAQFRENCYIVSVIAGFVLFFAFLLSDDEQPAPPVDDEPVIVDVYPPVRTQPFPQSPHGSYGPGLVPPVNTTSFAPPTPRIPQLCRTCNGVGDCPICNGDGDASEWSYSGTSRPCSACQGTGQCYMCGGVGTR